MARENTIARPAGAILHSARLYDALVWFALRGRERQLRQRLLDLSGVRSGESVLDVGCGTGTLAILAKQIVGPSGTVCGVDASAEMLARARSKAVRAGVGLVSVATTSRKPRLGGPVTRSGVTALPSTSTVSPRCSARHDATGTARAWARSASKRGARGNEMA